MSKGYVKVKTNTCPVCGKEFIPFGKHDCYCKDYREENVKRDNEILKNANQIALANLACEVVRTSSVEFEMACKKYHASRRKYEIARTYKQIESANIQRENATGEMHHEILWWLGKGFEAWGGELDGKKIIKNLIQSSEELNHLEKLNLLEVVNG